MQVQTACFVLFMPVKTCRKQHQLGAEGRELGQPLFADGCAEDTAACTRFEGRMQHILIAGVLFRLREGEDVGFKQVEKHHTRIVLENLRRTVAEVDVEIDDGDALQAVLGNGVHHAGGNVVDQAKAAGAVAVGMVAWRADGAEGMPGLFVHDHIDCLDDGACRKTGGLEGVVADDGIVVDAVDFTGERLGGF